MKTEEDEAFEDIERRQGGFQAKRAMAADKLQEFCTCHETHPMECQGCRANRLAQPAQEQWKCVGPPCKCNASNAKQCCYAVFTTPPQPAQEPVFKWRSVFQEMPTEDSHLLFCFGVHVVEGSYTRNGWASLAYGEAQPDFWAYMPPPPHHKRNQELYAMPPQRP